MTYHCLVMSVLGCVRFDVGAGVDKTRVGLTALGDETTIRHRLSLEEGVDADVLQLAVLGLDNTADSVGAASGLEWVEGVFQEEGRSRTAYPWILVSLLASPTDNAFQLMRLSARVALQGLYLQSHSFSTLCGRFMFFVVCDYNRVIIVLSMVLLMNSL